ncbi:glycerol-3-phosphate dehydrogenase/oxidase [Pigmentibacter ruber]|uniref:glycerol-3-phosphate dehydrogenase/oxidase n=1 Tax=Pigmentibacter ruber TaxID=2683196 RepID=UPI00131ECCD5|nr:FAD-dependent oxidoreductase [Pigmentibacter ruber]BFD32716.1 FAD-dependent oxidoreductase [Pigmentibacter ruber]
MDLNVLIVGGGIHGVGLLHDLATRKIHGIHLVEKNKIASGTSSRSTKLVHGGLRYLEHINQWSLVKEALKERSLLLKLLNGIVKPLPFVLPNFHGDKRPPWMVRLGLFFYDLLAGDCGLPSATKISKDEIIHYAPYLNVKKIESEMISAFLYYDAQMLDDVIAKLVVEASVKLGASYEEDSEVTRVQKIEGGFRVTIKSSQEERTLTTKYIINAAGAWCNENLLKWDIIPNIPCLLNLGTHIIFRPEVVKNGKVENSFATLIQEPDGRIVFFIPWFDKWLFGTTESILNSRPSQIKYPQEDKQYLMHTASEVLNLSDAEQNISEIFCGVRCMPLNQKTKFSNLKANWVDNPYESPFYLNKLDKNISGLSRETVIDEPISGLFCIYGGKYTTYRAVGEKIGSLLSKKLKMGTLSGTHIKENWFIQELINEKPEIFKTSPELRQI